MATNALSSDQVRRLGAGLKAAREAKGLSHAEAAQHTGLPPHRLQRAELGRAQPSVEALGKLCELYGVTVDSILAETP